MLLKTLALGRRKMGSKALVRRLCLSDTLDRGAGHTEDYGEKLSPQLSEWRVKRTVRKQLGRENGVLKEERGILKDFAFNTRHIRQP